MNLFPFADCCRRADEIIKQGGAVYQQFNCAKCGMKQTMPDADKFYTHGICEECKHETNIERDGCNYMVLWTSGGKV